MLTVEAFVGTVAREAFPGQTDGEYGIDIASIIAIVEALSGLCNLSPEDYAERAAGLKESSFVAMRDRARVWRAAADYGIPRRKRRDFVKAFCECCNRTPKADLAAGIAGLRQDG